MLHLNNQTACCSSLADLDLDQFYTKNDISQPIKEHNVHEKLNQSEKLCSHLPDIWYYLSHKHNVGKMLEFSATSSLVIFGCVAASKSCHDFGFKRWDSKMMVIDHLRCLGSRWFS